MSYPMPDVRRMSIGDPELPRPENKPVRKAAKKVVEAVRKPAGKIARNRELTRQPDTLKPKKKK